MMTTRQSLIMRVRDLRDEAAWTEFYHLYAPVLFAFARRCGLAASDAEEVRDRCLEALLQALPGFRYDRARGGFHRWLRTIARAKVSDHLRARRGTRLHTERLAVLADAATDPERLWEEEWRRHVLRTSMDEARRRVSGKAYRAFERLCFDGATVATVAAELCLNANQVYKAKSAVLAAVREAMRRHDDHA
ncbi:MAG: sigma-70 family RNA polymerase sigma factor [Planctomycetota bacterium]